MPKALGWRCAGHHRDSEAKPEYNLSLYIIYGLESALRFLPHATFFFTKSFSSSIPPLGLVLIPSGPIHIKELRYPLPDEIEPSLGLRLVANLGTS